jgi:hypothetical protein
MANLEQKISELSLNDNELFIKPDIPDYAIALIDISASTTSKFSSKRFEVSRDFEESVFCKQLEVLKSLPHKHYYLLFWCSHQNSGTFANGSHTIAGPVNISNAELIFKYEYKLITNSFLTNTALAFKNIPPEWLNVTNTVYLITDGEIGGWNLNSHEIKNELSNYLKNFKGSLSILTVERVARDYDNINEVQLAAGTDVFQLVQDNQLTGFLSCFRSYYPRDKDMLNFTHISKVFAPKGYIPYGDKYFLEMHMDKFVQYVAQELKDHPSETDQLSIAQKLSTTLSILLKNKSKMLIECNLRSFSKLFNVDNQAIYYILGDSLLAEQQGRAQILASYRSKLSNLYKNAQAQLSINVAKAINLGSNFYSYLFNDVENNCFRLLTGPSRLATETFVSKNTRFPKSAIGKTPVFGDNLQLSDFNEQCVRQWARAVYSTNYPVKVTDDIIIYLVLLDSLIVHNSDADITIKNAYLNLAKCMLNKKRSQVNITEAAYLLAGNVPTCSHGTFDDFIKIMNDMLNMRRINFKPMKVWHEMIKMLENVFPGMFEAQKNHTLNHVDLIDNCDLVLPAVKIDVISNSNIYDYTCYITMEDLTKTGGFGILSHKSPSGHNCSPIFMVSESGLNELSEHKEITCPVCYTRLTKHDFNHIGPQIESKIPEIYNKYNLNNISESKKIHNNTPVQDCYVIIMKGTVGAGKSTLSDFIERKYINLGYKVFNEGTDKYCRLGMTPQKASVKVIKELKLASSRTSKCIVIIDTCGESRNSEPFGVQFPGWKVIEHHPNYDESNKMGYLAWSLTNVLARAKPDASSLYYLSPYSKGTMAEGIQLCKDVHKKKAVSLGIYDNNFNKLSDNDRIILSKDYEKKLKPCEFDIHEF